MSNATLADPEEVTSEPKDDFDITDEELRITMVSAVEEMMRQKLDEEFSKTKAELESLHHTNLELLDNQEEISNLEKDLDEKIKIGDERNKDLTDCHENLLKIMDNLDKDVTKDTLDPDKIVLADSKVHNQILDCHALDLSLDDAIYMLGEGLRLGKVPCDVYLKTVRNLSRKQFYARALRDKCCEKANT